MHENLKHLIKKSKELFSLDSIDNLSKKSRFVKRKGKISAEKFIAFSIFSSEDLCTKSLSSLCARLEVQFGIAISPQSLNDWFNDDSVKFLKELFNIMLIKENNLFQVKETSLSQSFNRILVTDSRI